MKLWVDVKAYRRKFLRPLNTAHGPWHWREGILVKMQDWDGNRGYGEVAPLPWFGTESIKGAQQFWLDKTGWIDSEELLKLPAHLPATRFAAETALAQLDPHWDWETGFSTLSIDQSDICGLLPAGERALGVFPEIKGRGYQTSKWKIGVFPIEQELAWFKALVNLGDGRCQYRLDANGGLSRQAAEIWLNTCDSLATTNHSQSPSTETIAQASFPHQAPPKPVEFLEQPLPAQQVDVMEQLCNQYQTPIALDESVVIMEPMQNKRLQRWPGLLVVKPAIAGSPLRLQQCLSPFGPRIVFSSVFETIVGRQAALQTALGYYRRTATGERFPALGFDTLGYFDDDWDHLSPEQLWETI